MDDSLNSDELKQKIIASEHERARMEAILKSVANGLIVCDQQNFILLINKSACDMLGWRAEDALGKPLTEVAPISYFRQEQQSPSVLSATDTRTAQFYLLRRDGTKLPVELVTSSIIFANAVIGSVILFRDITHEIEISRSKSDFVAIASHQLRTPLGSIKWNLEMLLQDEFGKLPDSAKETLNLILRSNQRMIDLVNDLLSVSRIDLGADFDQLETVNIKQIINDVLTESKIAAQKKNLIIEFNPNPNISWNLTLDRRKFYEVVTNLVNNAIKYNRTPGKITIILIDNIENIQIALSDTGIGIPPKDQNRVFTKFYRSDNAVKSNTEGTGLGLYVVKSYVDKWHGKIWFESEINKGTTFHLELPKK